MDWKRAKMRGKLHQKLNNESGFTLAETLVALAISAVLLAITIVGIIQYSRNMKLTEMDTTAKAIFIAAQNHLTQADASGELKRYREKALDKTDTSVMEKNLGTLMGDRAPEDVPEGISWPSPNKDYYYIEYNTKTSTSVANLEGSILKYMLPFGAIDETVRADGKYIIEYNVKTATVYSVFYVAGDEDTDFNYTDIIKINQDGGRADTAEGRHMRRDYSQGIIGYYGGAMAGKLLSAQTSDLDLTIKNKDTLELSVIDPNYFNKATDGTTLVQTHLTLLVKGKESGNEEKFTLDLKDSTSTSAAPTKKDENRNLWWSIKNVELNEAGTGSTKTGVEYTITLDDITRPGGHFADICPSLMPGEDIIIKVISSSTTALATVREAEGLTNSLFESVKKDSEALKQGKKQSIASIGFLRHFENLDPEVSRLPKNTDAVKDGAEELYKPEYLVKKAEQTKDMDWAHYFGSDSKALKSVYKSGLKEDAINAEKLADQSYFGIKNNQLTEYNGNGNAISNVVIDNKSKSEGNGYANAGLFRYIEVPGSGMTIEKLTLKDFKVSAVKNAATLAGEIQGAGRAFTISEVLVDGGEISSSHAQGNSGGLIGYSGVKLTVDNCTAVVKSVATGARIYISASDYKYAGDAGGLIGEINGTGSTIRNSYSGGQTEDGKYKHDDMADYNIRGVDMAGGLIGKVNAAGNTITDCYSTCSVYVDKTGIEGTGYAGGLIGGELKAGTNTYRSCYATGYVDGKPGQKLGAFIGKANAGDRFINCEYLEGINVAEDGDERLDATATLQAPLIAGVSYGDMTTGEVKITYAFDKTLKDSTYPFKTVNMTGIKEKVHAAGVHYGDWQKPEEKVTGTNMFAYREHMKGDAASDYHWYIYGAELKNELVTYSQVYTDLVTDKNQYVDKAVYGFLSKEKQLNDQFKGNEIKNIIDSNNPEEVKINKETYYFYEIKNYGKLTYEDVSVGGGIVSIAQTPQWYLGKGKKHAAQFQFNPGFAAAISREGQYKFGTTSNPYQIRTDSQLRQIGTNIAKEDSYNSYAYSQTVSIQLSDDEFKAFGKDEGFLGSFSAASDIYQINNFYQTIDSTSEKTGLIKKLSGTVANINLFGKIHVTTSSCKEIGSITGEMSGGMLNNCSSEVEINVTFNSTNADILKVGGLVGNSIGTKSSAIDSCKFSGDIRVTSNLKSTRIGGLVGDSAVPIKNSTTEGTVHAKISDNGSGYDWQVGGFAGILNTGLVENCWSQADITTSKPNANMSFMVGGFAGAITNGAASKCWTKATIENEKYNSCRTGGFVGIIEDFTSISNSYAAVFFNYTGADNTNNTTAFIGYTKGNTKSDWKITNCHAVMLDKDYELLATKNYFVKADGSLVPEYKYCYLFTSRKGNASAKFINSKETYRKMETFEGFDAQKWHVVNDKYPTLIENPEPSKQLQKNLNKMTEDPLSLPSKIE